MKYLILISIFLTACSYVKIVGDSNVFTDESREGALLVDVINKDKGKQ